MSLKPKPSILIVDDDRANIDVLNHILRSSYTIFVAKSGQAALKKAIETKPDLILLDIIMPDMSGYEVLAELKKDDRTYDIPVIFITGLANVEDEEKGLFLGAVDYITKPFHNSIVKARVKTHLQIIGYIRRIEQLGMLDALTDMPNRRCFDTQILAEWGRAARDKTTLCLLMIDVDKFKNYNDTYGHPQGDVLLQTISKIFSRSLKRHGDIAARLGGEEFAVLLPNTDLEGGLKIAEEIRKSVEEAEIANIADDSITKVTVSIGVAARMPSQENSIAQLTQDADSLLYEAKNTGRNKICW